MDFLEFSGWVWSVSSELELPIFLPMFFISLSGRILTIRTLFALSLGLQMRLPDSCSLAISLAGDRTFIISTISQYMISVIFRLIFSVPAGTLT